jgi:NAD(P)-dependent dehydrogenase (short-subunit alcohol dehydrogenase family)
MDLDNKTYIITGATSGIGLAAANALVVAGANVIGIGRSTERCIKCEKQLRLLNRNVILQYFVGDLSLQSNVRDLARQIKEFLLSNQLDFLDGIINVAGTFTYWLDLTPDGIEKQWAVNHLAGFLLTSELLPLLMAAPQARVITVSSGSHFGAHIDWQDPQMRHRYNGLKTYGVTKLANLLFTQEFNRRLELHPNVRAFAVDPGLVKTDIGSKDTPPIVRKIWNIRKSGGTSPDLPARCILHLLTEPLGNISSFPYWKNSRPKHASRAAHDQSSAIRLWQLSEKLCNIVPKD